MEFTRESEMLEPVKNWLESRGLVPRTEFRNPWGVCDLVGCRLKLRSVAERLALRQRAVIGPLQRIALLARIPDRDTGRTVTLKKLQRDHAAFIDPETIAAEVNRLVGTRFVQVTQRGSFQKINGWFPLHSQLVAVELKLTRIREVLDQAIANRDLTFESYAALPFSVAERLMNGEERNRFEHAGVGVIGVTPSGCQVLLAPCPKGHHPDTIAQTHCVERFWRLHVRGS